MKCFARLRLFNRPDRDALPPLPRYIYEANRDALRQQYPRIQVYDKKRCPICQSLLIGWKECGWNRDANGNRTAHYQRLEVICPFCERLTVADTHVPDNINAPIVVKPNTVGWLRCPNCNSLFSLDDGAAFADGLHRKCGQRLIVDISGP